MSVRPWIPNRSSKRVEAPPAEEITVATEVPPPNEIPEVVPPNKFQKLLPLLMGVAIIGMIGIFLSMGIRRMSPMMLMFPLMFLMAAGGMMAGHGNSGGPKTPEIDLNRRKYLEMLTGLRRKVHSRAAAQYRYLAHYAPSPDTLAALVSSPRQWERSAPDRDPTYFLAPRVGVAPQKLGGGMTMKETAEKKDLEPVARTAGERFFRAHRAVEGMPTLIDLKTHRAVQFFGEGDLASVVRALLLQVAVFHPPNMVMIAVVTNNPGEWDWIKWLPHNQHPLRQDALGTERMVYSPAEAGAALAELIADRGDFSADDKYTGAKPWLIVVADGVGSVPGCGEGLEAVTVIRRGEVDESGLETLGARVQIAADGAARKRRMTPDDPLKFWLSRADSVGVEQARQVARRMTRWRAATDAQILAGVESSLAETPKMWASLMGIDDVGSTGTSTWRTFREGDPDRMRVPIGWTKSGAVMSLNIKEEAEQGMGSHGVILGTTGSGKSTLLINLLLGLVARHTPEQLNLILVDYKGEATFDGFEKLNHTVEIISNLSSGKDMISRFEEVMRGAVEKRQAARSELGKRTVGKKFRDAMTYLKARERGAALPPFPTLLIVVDEFTALLKDHPEFRDVFEHLGRQGRSDRMNLLLATQSLTGVSVGQLLSNCGWKIAMKTAGAQDSQAVIETKEAYYLDKIGEGYLKVGGAEPQYFTAANPQAPYFPPVAAPERADKRGTVGFSGVAPFSVEAVPLPREEPVDGDGAPVVPVHTAEEIASAPEIASVMLDQLAGQGEPCEKLWLPPLLRPRPLGRLIADSGLRAGAKAVLDLPIGLIDRPYTHVQDVFRVDLTDSNLLLLGRPRSGKSVALQTLAVSAAALNNPRTVQIYGLDCGADLKLAALEGLPHVGGVAIRGDGDGIARVIAEVTEVMAQRRTLFRELRIGSMAAYRDKVAAGQAADDGYGDVLLLIDGWDNFKKENDTHLDAVANLTNNGLAVGIHVAVAVQVHSELGRAMNQSFSTRVDFKMNSPELSGVNNKRLAEAVPDDVPGRGLDLAEALHIMIGAPRLDDIEAVDDAGLAAAIAEIADRWQGQSARRVRRLPERVEASSLVVPPEWTGSKWSVPIGMYEKDLSTVMLDMLTDRHLNIFGRTGGGNGSGKTHLIAAIMKSLMARYSPDEVKFMVVDLKSSQLLDIIDERYILSWQGWETVPVANPAPGQPATTRKSVAHNGLILNATELTAAVEGIANALAGRTPTEKVGMQERRERSWWSGPEVFVFVDDYAMVNSAAPQAFAALAPYWGNAHSLGLHAVVSCPIGLATRVLAQSGSLLKMNNDVNGATLVMDGIKENGPILGLRVQPRVTGRGVLITAAGQEVIQTPVVTGMEDLAGVPGSS